MLPASCASAPLLPDPSDTRHSLSTSRPSTTSRATPLASSPSPLPATIAWPLSTSPGAAGASAASSRRRYNAAGDRFFVVTDNCSKRVLCAAAARNELLYTCGEYRKITAWDMRSRQVAYSFEQAHTNRVKDIVVLADSDTATGTGSSPYPVASASSDGFIRVWDARMIKGPVAEWDTKSRLTCLAGSHVK